MEMTSPSARVQVRKVSELRLPATCASCGNGTCLDGYVDLDIYFEYEGNIYICMNCSKEAATAIGCLLPAESRHLEELNEHIAQELKETKEKLVNYERFDNLIKYFVGSSLDASESAGSVPTGLITEDAAKQSADLSSTPDVSDGGEPEPSEPVAKQGPVRPRRPTASDKPKLNI